MGSGHPQNGTGANQDFLQGMLVVMLSGLVARFIWLRCLHLFPSPPSWFWNRFHWCFIAAVPFVLPLIALP